MTTFKAPPKPRPPGKWGTAFDILRDILYGKRPYIDLYEQTTLNFIYGRTRYYGKEWEYIPLRHFMCGIWSLDHGCVCPRIRISETKLLEALKNLKAKNIIEVEHRVARSNRYRIREDREIDMSGVIRYIADHQADLVAMIVREMQHNLARLNDAEVKLLSSWKEILAEHDVTRRNDPIARVPAARPLRQRATSQMGERKKPIFLKIPVLQPASPKRRRLQLPIIPLKRIKDVVR
jgi:hypothetical protein